MPLRVTIELIPRGDEDKKSKLAVVNIVNIGTGTAERGNYRVFAQGEIVGGWDYFADKIVTDVKRGDYINCVIHCLDALEEK